MNKGHLQNFDYIKDLLNAMNDYLNDVILNFNGIKELHWFVT